MPLVSSAILLSFPFLTLPGALGGGCLGGGGGGGASSGTYDGEARARQERDERELISVLQYSASYLSRADQRMYGGNLYRLWNGCTGMGDGSIIMLRS